MVIGLSYPLTLDMTLGYANTPNLRIGYYDHGPPTGWRVILSHGFPYDPGAYDEVVPVLVEQGARVIIPYLRGFGPTTYTSDSVPRSGQQAALGMDIIELMDALEIHQATLGGFDWGGLASTVAAALYPDRVSGLVTLACYDLIDRKAQLSPFDPELEERLWYQHLFQSERGRQCLEQHRDELTEILWKQWSPTWLSGSVFGRTKKSFQNPDFVPTVISAYRFVLGSEDGAEQYQAAEDILAKSPDIVVLSITIDGRYDTLKPGGTGSQAHHFTGRHEHWISEIAGHALPYEDPEIFAKAILKVKFWSKD